MAFTAASITINQVPVVTLDGIGDSEPFTRDLDVLAIDHLEVLLDGFSGGGERRIYARPTDQYEVFVKAACAICGFSLASFTRTLALGTASGIFYWIEVLALELAAVTGDLNTGVFLIVQLVSICTPIADRGFCCYA